MSDFESVDSTLLHLKPFPGHQTFVHQTHLYPSQKSHWHPNNAFARPSQFEGRPVGPTWSLFHNMNYSLGKLEYLPGWKARPSGVIFSLDTAHTGPIKQCMPAVVTGMGLIKAPFSAFSVKDNFSFCKSISGISWITFISDRRHRS